MHRQVEKIQARTQTELKCIPTIREKGSLAAHTHTKTSVSHQHVSCSYTICSRDEVRPRQ